MSQNKIPLVTLKNNRQTRNQIKVKPKISFADFKKKISATFTRKKFRLEYYSKEDNDWHNLQSQNEFKRLLANYNQEAINIITQEQRNENSESSQIKSNSQYKNSAYEDTSEIEQKDSVILDSELSKGQVDNEVTVKEQVSQNLAKYIENDFVKKQCFYEKGTDFDLTVKEIINIFVEIALKQMHQRYQVIKQKQSAIDLGKTCSQCKVKEFKGPYYICLICQNQYILCPECQAKQILPGKGLSTHLAKTHPFAKIKRFTQTIKTKKVTTCPQTELEFNNRSQNRVIRLGTNESQQQINKQLLDKFNRIYEELIEKSQFHFRNYYNPTNTPYSVRRRDNYLKPAILQKPIKTQIQIRQGQSEIKTQLNILPDTDKQRKFKRLKRMGLSQQQVKKYTSGQYQNKTYSQVIKQIFQNR